MEALPGEVSSRNFLLVQETERPPFKAPACKLGDHVFLGSDFLKAGIGM